jgi:hypothetical protein
VKAVVHKSFDDTQKETTVSSSLEIFLFLPKHGDNESCKNLLLSKHGDNGCGINLLLLKHEDHGCNISGLSFVVKERKETATHLASKDREHPGRNAVSCIQFLLALVFFSFSF